MKRETRTVGALPRPVKILWSVNNVFVLHTFKWNFFAETRRWVWWIFLKIHGIFACNIFQYISDIFTTWIANYFSFCNYFQYTCSEPRWPSVQFLKIFIWRFWLSMYLNNNWKFLLHVIVLSWDFNQETITLINLSIGTCHVTKIHWFYNCVSWAINLKTSF